MFRIDGQQHALKRAIPLARLKGSSEINFFPNTVPGAAWEYNDFDVAAKHRHGRGETPTFAIDNWKNKWKSDDTIEVTCSGIC